MTAAMTSGPGKFLVTIRIERGDGRSVTSALLLPGNLLAAGAEDQERAADEMSTEFARAYQRAAELPH